MGKFNIGDRVNVIGNADKIPSAFLKDCVVTEIDRPHTCWPVMVKASNGVEEQFAEEELERALKFKVGDRVDSTYAKDSGWHNMVITKVPEPGARYPTYIARTQNGTEGGFEESELLPYSEEVLDVTTEAEKLAVDLRLALADANRLRKQLVGLGWEVDETFWFDDLEDGTTPAFEILKRL